MAKQRRQPIKSRPSEQEKAAQRGVKLKTGEFNFLLLLAGEHPSLQLVEKAK